MGIYIATYKESGLAGLVLGHSTSKPLKLSLEQKAILVETVSTRVPADVGFTPRYNWKLALVVEFVYSKMEWFLFAAQDVYGPPSFGVELYTPHLNPGKSRSGKAVEVCRRDLPRTKKIIGRGTGPHSI